jgi:hypothetical protein
LGLDNVADARDNDGMNNTSKARIYIRPFRGVLASEGMQHRTGFIVSGTDSMGRNPSIFVFTREAAEATKRYLRTGEGQIVFGQPS